MKKSEIVNRLVEKYSLDKSLASQIVNLIFDEIVAITLENGRLEIRGFGSFRLKRKNGRFIKNPKSGVEIFVDSRYVISFKPFEGLLNRVNGKV